MFYPPLLYELTPLYLAQGALTLWMLIDAHRRGVEYHWFWIILAFQPFGAWAYFFVYKVKDFSGGTNRFANLFTRRPSLDELRYRAEQSPTTIARLDLAERLVETQEYEEAVPHWKAVLSREPDHRTALFGQAECHRQLAQHAEAVPLLLKLVALQSNWRNELAWHTLIETYQETGDYPEAVAQARKLAQIVPSLEHKCLLARCLLEADNAEEATANRRGSAARVPLFPKPQPQRPSLGWQGEAAAQGDGVGRRPPSACDDARPTLLAIC